MEDEGAMVSTSWLIRVASGSRLKMAWKSLNTSASYLYVASCAKPPPSWNPRMFMSNDSWFPRFRYTQPGHASMYLWEGGGRRGEHWHAGGQPGHVSMYPNKMR